MPDDEVTADIATKAVDEQARRIKVAATTYEALRSKKRLQSHRLLAYRCTERDLLLDVMNFPTGVVLYVPANTPAIDTTPPALTQVGRPAIAAWANARDVEDRSRSCVLLADQCETVTVACSHVGTVRLQLSRIHRDVYLGHAEVIIADVPS